MNSTNSTIRNSKGTTLGIAVIVLSVVLPLAGFGLLVSQAPQRVIDRAVRALAENREHVERALATEAASPAATEAEPTSETAAPAVIEYTFSDEEGLVIEGCTPPACSEVSFNEAEGEPIIVDRRPARDELARR